MYNVNFLCQGQSMPLHEFDIISKYFKKTSRHTDEIAIGVGDDAAVVNIPEGYQLVTAIDTLVEGRHFLPNAHPADIGHRALAVNLSDLAAMGAEPKFALLGLTLPKANPDWLTKFSKGFFDLAKEYKVDLIGGDITKGPLTISVTINGIVPKGKALTQRGAKAGDLIYVSNYLGDAGLALQFVKDNKKLNDYLTQRFYRPTPQIQLGLALRDIATSCIDISDGLSADLNKILTASNIGAAINLPDIPLSDELKNQRNDLELALNSGDDYELCFTINPINNKVIEQITKKLNIKLTCIGTIKNQAGIVALDSQGNQNTITSKGYQHF
jgi:thiamine-monophosphate kinase